MGTAAIDEIEMWPKSSSMVCSMVWRGKEGLGGNKHLRRNGNKARKEGDDSLHKNTHKNTYKIYTKKNVQKNIQIYTQKLHTVTEIHTKVDTKLHTKLHVCIFVRLLRWGWGNDARQLKWGVGHLHIPKFVL